MKYCLILLITLSSSSLFAQKYTISGSVKDSTNGEDLYGATVQVKELTNVGAKTNSYGFFSLTLEKGSYTLIFRSTGFDQKEVKIVLDKDIILHLELNVPSSVLQLGDVHVRAEKENENITSPEMNVTKLTPKDIETIPVLFGEKDIMKTLQLTPGIKGAGEGNAGFFVRGGGADQNLILLDEAPVYNASHLLGFFSVFNSDAIKDVALYKAGIPAEYGGRASSVMDVKMKDGNKKKFAASGGIGMISSRLTVEGPIVKNKGSFIISGRRSYVDLFLKLSKDEQIQNTSLYFYDLNMKANYKFGDKDRVFLSGYFGRDNFGFGDDFGFNWGNATGTLRWNHIVSKKLFSNTSLIYSNFDYAFNIGPEGEDDSFGVKSSIQDWNVKQDFTYYANKNNTMKFGVNGIHHTFKPGALTGGNESFNEVILDSRYAVEMGAYVQNTHKIGTRINLMYGLRYSGFNLIGDGNMYEFDENGVSTTTEFDKWKTIKFHQGLEPRFSASYVLTEYNSIKLAYNRNFQYLHQVSNSTSSSPTDIWVPSSNNVNPQIADQLAVGYYHNLKKNMYALSGEIYYKILQNQIDYKNGASSFLNDEVEGEFVYGKGRAYGLEIQLQKKKGKFTGWISYTLSRSLRTFDKIDGGKEFSARQDRIHDISVVAMYKINKAVAVSATWIYYTGDAVTFPSGGYTVNNTYIPQYTERNGYRMPDYHRLDLGLTWYLKEKKRFDSNINFSVYNAYSRENAYTITFEPEDPYFPNGPQKAVQTTLFKLIPAITWNFNIK
ncbi:MAG: TonB-dependent receptor [Crocinitomicaceae bacterium]|nr:TonB-dependent receptor [Crocinitomicaceae bacterium]